MIRDWTDACLSDTAVQHAQLLRRAKTAIIELSTTYSLVSEHTSFVAVEERLPGEAAEAVDWAGVLAAAGVDRLVHQAFEEPSSVSGAFDL